MTEGILATERVTKKFGELIAVNAVDVVLSKGDILGLIGPNGSGKTTLFNIISGIHRPNSGEVRYKGTPITGKKPHVICRGGLARTFQVAQPFPRMTLWENVLIAAMYGKGLSRVMGLEKARETLRFVGLHGKANRTPDEVTTEDRRRLELARALVTDPEILLLDEIMAGLTPAEVVEALDLLRLIHGRGITIFMVEHIMQAVMTLCNRVVVLNYGKKIAEGSPRDVAENSEVITAYLGDRHA